MTVFDKFLAITKYDLSVLFTDYVNFIETKLPLLVSYYKGISNIDKYVFIELKRLDKELNKVDELISIHKTTLSTSTEFWDLIENISDIRTKIDTINNLPKWLRSSYYYGYENKTKQDYILKQNQTLENLSIMSGSNAPNEDWVNLAIDNSLEEIEYSKQGGNFLKIPTQNNEFTGTSSVVDIMIGDNVLGKDLPSKITIEDEDLVSLPTTDTMNQSADICLKVSKGSVPEFPSVGIPKQLVGSNINSLQSVTLMREVLNNFRTDDSFSNVQLIDSNIDQDNVFYNFQIVSRLNTELNKSI